ncbi:MAG: fluoride efflux transporter CrcB [Rhodospirillaceae bacterium]|nr:fluoride efflux transporter CrcB [Rhodospirillaceae bacterium]|tara:strand:+ start:48 stop:428 length:381 start_codon:yes stop_codon:yes gene_type:complete
MKLILLVAVGGAIGAAARFQSDQLFARIAGDGSPYSTLFVNVVGSFLMGVLFEYLNTKFDHGIEWRAFLLVGVLGAFTTFSSFALDVSVLSERANYFGAGLYILTSVIISILGLFLGLWIMKSFLG